MFCPINSRAHFAILPWASGVLDDFPKWVLGHHRDGVRVEVVPKFALGHQDHVHKLLHL
jgi:hypothetical protein